MTQQKHSLATVKHIWSQILLGILSRTQTQTKGTAWGQGQERQKLLAPRWLDPTLALSLYHSLISPSWDKRHLGRLSSHVTFEIMKQLGALLCIPVPSTVPDPDECSGQSCGLELKGPSRAHGQQGYEWGPSTS